ncbi:MAG: outer membrane protein assembly factor BamE (lipoprotein component of BamABCDE complex) [Oleiphilaceae bacterium]|jgi:outer membrane protein assembly factor BamE (lipoprotein component of BamABCDE complex)
MKNKLLAASLMSVALLTGCQTTESGDNDSGFTKFTNGVKNVGAGIGNGAASVTGALDYKNGVYISEEQLAKIKPGKTTEAEVIAVIGQPTNKTQLKDKEVWSYPYSKIGTFSGNTNETTTIEVNNGIVVSAYKSNSHQKSTGNPLDYVNGVFVSEDDLAKIKQGKMTEADVIAVIGQPTNKNQLNDKEVWSYPYTKIGTFSGNTNETTTIEFKHGIVVNAYKSNSRKTSSGNPLVDAANGV